MDNWNTMDTAPLDGTHVLLWARELGTGNEPRLMIGFYRRPGIGTMFRNDERETGWHSIEKYTVEYPDDVETRSLEIVPSRWTPEPPPPSDPRIPTVVVQFNSKDMRRMTAADYDIFEPADK
jgi:hypothetical protein